jgi:hypothetical protein
VAFTRYYYDEQIRENNMSRHVAHMEHMTNAYRILVGQPEKKGNT